MSAGGELAVTGIGVVAPEGPPAPQRPWFDATVRLGARGHKYLPPASQYLLAAARAAVADGGRLDHVVAEQRGGAVGTNSGLAAMHDDLDCALVDGRTDVLSPATAPFFAANLVSSRLAAELGLRGFTLSLTSPRIAGLEALDTGGRAAAAGRCAVLLAAVTEHRPPAAPADRAAAGEEGAVVLVTEPAAAAAARGARVHGVCRARVAFAPPRLLTGAPGLTRLTGLIEDLLYAVGACADPLPVHPVLDASPVSAAVADVLAAVHGGAHPVRLPVPAGAGCLAALRCVADLLTGGPGECLVVAATAEGNLAVARISVPHPRSGPTRGSGTR